MRLNLSNAACSSWSGRHIELPALGIAGLATDRRCGDRLAIIELVETSRKCGETYDVLRVGLPKTAQEAIIGSVDRSRDWHDFGGKSTAIEAALTNLQSSPTGGQVVLTAVPIEDSSKGTLLI